MLYRCPPGTLTIPGAFDSSIAEQGDQMEICKKLQGLAPQPDNPELMPF